ncbi:MAG: toxin TcdB middle/N-terminal domain-containing protein [Polyangiaceae bacterium]|nr:toxin TcdB middle/N-terminal domain-containing protein [Polyangiaceae bacterium]
MKRSIILRVLSTWIFACFVFLLASPLRASGVDPTKISLPKGPGSIEGLGRSFTASLAAGTASFGLDIAVPPAAAGFGPALSLEYDGGGGVSELGMGFRLGGLPKVRLRTTDGVPRFDASDRFELVGLGLPSALLEVAPGVFRPEQESGAFVRVKRSADGKVFEARTKNGVTYRFGGDGYTEEGSGKVVSYLLREQLDLHGHRIAYVWDTASGYALLTSVVWNAFSPESTAKIELSYSPGQSRYELYSAGIRQLIEKQLSQIEVTYGGALVRRYSLEYSAGTHAHLTHIKLVGADGVTAAPELSLAYTEATLSAQGVKAMQDPPGRSPREAGVEFADLNGDGLPDLVVGAAGSFRTYVNQDGQSWLPPQDFAPGNSPSVSLGSVGVQLADIDGDAAIDLVVKSGTADFRYLPGKNAGEFGSAVAIATVPAFSFEDPDVRLADMDGDRRTDAVITTDAGLAISYNLSGKDWAPPVTVGKIDATQPLRFSDGQTTLCDINGDRVQDICHLRSEGLSYYLGRGRGRFEAARVATGVPAFDVAAPFQLVDLDGDGWDDLVRVGTTSVSYALANAIGNFDALQTLSGTPEKGPNGASFFVDINSSGSTDIVWVDPTLGPEKAWQYLELFPEGRAGLLQKIDNGLGKVTTISYTTAASFAASARSAGKPWTTRVNAGLPVVSRITTDSGLGDPPLVTEFIYRDGAWDPNERTFAGFGAGIQKEVGDEFSPTLLSETTFNMGLTTHALRGAPSLVEVRDETGKVFQRKIASYQEVTLETALDGGVVHYGYASAERVQHVEGAVASAIRETLTEWEQDAYGNVIREKRWGEVRGEDRLHGNDETLIQRTFANDPAEWLFGFVATEEVTEADGTRRALKRNYYDGEPFVGLPLEQITRGDLVRQEEWVGPSATEFEMVTATRYNSDGLPIETKDARGGGRIFEWDPVHHTGLTSEKVKLESAVDLTEHATYDPRFGTLLTATEYNGQTRRYEYDPLGRVVRVFAPGDPADAPTTTYRYIPGAPLSRVVTESRTGVETAPIQHGEALSDGLGRPRGSLTRVDDTQWVLAGVRILNARGEAKKDLRPRFIPNAIAEDPKLSGALLEDGRGSTTYADALGRVVRAVSPSGIETRAEYAPLQKKTWDGGQLDASAGYELTPTIAELDGQGREVQSLRTLKGQVLAAKARFDAAGRLVSRTDPEGNTASYEYDGRGRRTAVHDPDLGTHTNIWDPTGNLIERRRPDGTIIRYNFDLAGRLVSEDWGADGTLDVEETWDVAPSAPEDLRFRGKLVRAKDATATAEFTYDERSRITETRLAIMGQSFVTKSQFDNLDREVLHTYPDGSSIRIGRNSRGQLAEYGDALKVTYGGDGLEQERRFNTGVLQKFDFDADDRLTEQRILSANGSLVEHLKWTFDPGGNLTGVEDRRPDITPDLDRSETYHYDNLYRLTGVDGRWGNTSWTYSPTGNLLSRKSTIPGQTALVLTYGNGMRPHVPATIDGQALSFDAMGRLTNEGGRSYRWNNVDQLEEVTNADGSSVRNHFDREGVRRVRVEKAASGQESKVVFIDQWSEVRDGKLERYIVHADKRVAKLAAGNGVAGAGLVGGSTAGDAAGGKTGAFGHFGIWFAQVAATGYLFLAPLLLVVLGWHYRRRLLWPVRLAFAVLTLLAVSACGSDSPKAAVPGGSVQVLTAEDTLIFSDPLGSVLVETSGNGEVRGRFASYPYGVSRYDSSSEISKYATGIRDKTASLDQMGARFYSHQLGFWISGDPVAVDEPERYLGAEFGAANPYAYANLTPMVARDSKGEFWQILVGAGVGALVGGGLEAFRQYSESGSVSDFGRVAAATGGGCVAGAVFAFLPAAGLGEAMLTGGLATAAGGLTERGIASGGNDFGTLHQVASDASMGAASGGALRGTVKVVTAAGARSAKPATVLSSESAWQAQYKASRTGGGSKTYQTYTKTNPTTGEVYSGRTSGTGTPEQNIARRDTNHHMNEQGFGPAQLDKSSANKSAIRGREQQLIDANGGAKSRGGTSGNAINGISPSNPKKSAYIEAAKKEFEQ